MAQASRVKRHTAAKRSSGLRPEDRMLCVSGFALAKQGNHLRPELEAGCRALLDPALGARCLEQFGRHYYALGNPTLMRML